MSQLDFALARVRRLTDALLYEGYLLYPYRKSSQKNQRRWMFGTLVPKLDSEALGGGDPWRCQSECLIEGDVESSLEIVVRFLHFGTRLAEDGSSFEEASERTVNIGQISLQAILAQPIHHSFQFAADEGSELRQRPLQGLLEVTACLPAPQVVRLRVQVMNLTPLSDETLPENSSLRALTSVHALLIMRGGAFASQIDPEARLQPFSADCRNVGLFPVLVGQPGSRDLLLCAPIILSDYPEIAPQSPGDLFDATEIDEILTLRLLTLSEAEKREVAAGDERAKRLLARVEKLGEGALSQLHGTMGAPPPPRRTTIAGVEVGPGARVRLHPRAGGDVLDLALAGQVALVTSVEEDFEGRKYITVAIEDDPGRDLGQRGQPGHRFFFFCDEVEPLPAPQEGST